MKKVFVHSSLEHVYAVRDLLNAKGISATVFNEHSAMTPAVPGGSMLVPPEVWIYDDDLYEQARVLIKETRKTQQQKNESPSNSSWICSACDEENPVNFEICWQCQKHA